MKSGKVVFLIHSNESRAFISPVKSKQYGNSQAGLSIAKSQGNKQIRLVPVVSCDLSNHSIEYSDEQCY